MYNIVHEQYLSLIYNNMLVVYITVQYQLKSMRKEHEPNLSRETRAC